MCRRGKEGLGCNPEEQPAEEAEEGQPERSEETCKCVFQRGNRYHCLVLWSHENSVTSGDLAARAWWLLGPEQRQAGWVGCEEGASAGLCGPLRALGGMLPLGRYSPWGYDLVGGPRMRLQLPHATTFAGAFV